MSEDDTTEEEVLRIPMKLRNIRIRGNRRTKASAIRRAFTEKSWLASDFEELYREALRSKEVLLDLGIFRDAKITLDTPSDQTDVDGVDADVQVEESVPFRVGPAPVRDFAGNMDLPGGIGAYYSNVTGNADQIGFMISQSTRNNSFLGIHYKYPFFWKRQSLNCYLTKTNANHAAESSCGIQSYSLQMFLQNTFSNSIFDSCKLKYGFGWLADEVVPSVRRIPCDPTSDNDWERMRKKFCCSEHIIRELGYRSRSTLFASISCKQRPVGSILRTSYSHLGAEVKGLVEGKPILSASYLNVLKFYLATPSESNPKPLSFHLSTDCGIVHNLIPASTSMIPFCDRIHPRTRYLMGFSMNSMGPHTPAYQGKPTGDGMGGNVYAFVNAMISAPLGRTLSLGRLTMFCGVGNIWDGIYDIRSDNVQCTYGFGLYLLNLAYINYSILQKKWSVTFKMY